MKIKPEERPAVIGLGVAIGVVLIFGATRFLPQLLSSDKANNGQNGIAASALTGTAGTTNGAATAGMSAPGVSTAAQVPGSKTDMYNDTIVEPPTTPDPFKPVVASADMVAPSIPGSVVNPPRITIPRQRVQQYPPPLIVTTGFKTGTPFPGRVVSPPPISTPSVTDPNSQAGQMILAGVIAGPQAVAVIHIGDRAYPLTSGEKMPFDMSLMRITEEGVYVKQGKQTWFIQVGKSLSAALPIKPGMPDFKAGSMAPHSSSGPVRRLTAAQDAQPMNSLEAGRTAAKGSIEDVSARAQP